MASVRHLGLFPWCIWPSKKAFIDYTELGTGGRLSYDELQNYFETITSDLQTIMALYWRVKKWKVSGDFQYTKESAGNPAQPVIETVPYEFFFERNKDPESSETLTKESDLVCLIKQEGSSQFLWPIIQFKRTGEPVEVVTAFGTGVWGARFACPIIPTFSTDVRPIIKQEPNLYSCGLDFAFNYEDGLEPDVDLYSGGAINLASNESLSNATVLITFLGQSFSILAADSNFGTGNPHPLVTTMSIDAEEYWPYDPNDGGGPIYSSATGAQLRDFYG